MPHQFRKMAHRRLCPCESRRNVGDFHVKARGHAERLESVTPASLFAMVQGKNEPRLHLTGGTDSMDGQSVIWGDR